LYWITRLDEVRGIFIALMLLSIIPVIVGFSTGYSLGPDTNEEERRKGKRMLRITSIIFILSAICFILTPDTKQALIIYGVGGTIDYVKSNDKAKQLPDKVIDALDRYLDSIDKGGENETDKSIL
jgi:hypothetical protein